MPIPPTPGDMLIADLNAAGTTIVAHLATAVAFDPAQSYAAITDFTEANFSGYEPITLNDWEDVAPGDTLIAHVLSAILHWEADENIAAPQQVVAVYVVGTKTGVQSILMSVELLVVPFTFFNPGDYLERQIRIEDTLNNGPTPFEA